MQLQAQIYKIQAEDFPRVVEVWKASVRYTHHFVSEADILFFTPIVQEALPRITQLACVRDDSDQVAGFVAVVNGNVDMLFIHPLARGLGAGRRRLEYAVTNFEAATLDVNEQNQQAVSFYLHMGFEVVGRSELDSFGKPYPLLHMRLADKSE